MRKANDGEEEKGGERKETRQLDSRINLGSSLFWPRGHEVEVSRTIGPFVSAGTKGGKERRALSRMDLIKKHNLEGGRITGSSARWEPRSLSPLPPPHE